MIPCGIATVYILINIAYTLGHEPVYPIMTWENWISYVFIIVAYVSALITFGIGILSYQRCCKQKNLQSFI